MAITYHLPEDVVKSTAIPISGRFLAHNRGNAAARAFLAADLHLGTRQLVLPTMTQAASLARINVTYAWWAAKRLEERAAIEGGMIPLVPPRLVAPETNGLALPALSEIPNDAWSAAKDLVAKYGPGVVFDQLIAPAIA